MKIGLWGYGKAGQAVARVLHQDPRFELCWVMRRRVLGDCQPPSGVRLGFADDLNLPRWLDQHPVDAILDFSHADSVFTYAEEVRYRALMVVSAVSAYSTEHLQVLQRLGDVTRVMSSPNITLGINFLMIAAELLRKVAPFADVAVLEQHFRDKPEVSGTALKLARQLGIGAEEVSSLRLGGIVGHHEVVFGFPHQTVRLSHDAIRREAFGTGAAYALEALSRQEPGFYAFDDLLRAQMRQQLLGLPEA